MLQSAAFFLSVALYSETSDFLDDMPLLDLDARWTGSDTLESDKLRT